MAAPAANAANSREIRVCIFSACRNFKEERDLLVKQVFLSLLRKDEEWGLIRW
ncbi:hypothetical protein [Synechococcus sp. BA-132 BA5]|uniref:hypothetical protein n=1 Tax=Synechococcus sp. BA-132 BA5 TaxID=3110252 RepID=UPI002B1F6B3D|nr:hypothetical protein [Synechococcus sp. BA-132 BA5]